MWVFHAMGGDGAFVCGRVVRLPACLAHRLSAADGCLLVFGRQVPMSPDASSPGTFTCTVHLNPGYHQFKFIVDQEWRHDPGMPAMPDPIGNVNNWLFVRKPEDDLAPSQVEEPAAPPTSMPATAPATVEDPRVTRTKIRDFLATHTSAELIPESGKVVLLDMDLPLRQALHALHDQVCVLSELRFPGC